MQNKTILSLVATLTAGVLAVSSMANESKEQPEELLKQYEAVSNALANDDLATAKQAAGQLAADAKATENQAIGEYANALVESTSLDGARESFKILSVGIAESALGNKTFQVMTCPMADAIWLQSGPKVMNPYMGKKMQQCGGPLKTNAGSARKGCCG